MEFICQLNYPELPYPTTLTEEAPLLEPYPSIAKAGCGLCSACMLLEGLTGQKLSLKEAVDFSIQNGANHAGTVMKVFAPAFAEKYGLTCAFSSDREELLSCLGAGGMAILNVGVTNGVFSDGGHFILAAKAEGRRVYILDPAYTPEKYEKPWRKAAVRIEYPYVVADIDTAAEQTAVRTPSYYLFQNAKKGV